MVDKNFIAEYLPAEPVRERAVVSSPRSNGTSLEKSMQTLWDKHCMGNIHTPELASFICACNAIGVCEDDCRNFVMSRQDLVSADSSKSDSRELEKLVVDLYKSYSSQHGQYKSEPI